jgi:hypothetical protein
MTQDKQELSFWNNERKFVPVYLGIVGFSGLVIFLSTIF